MIKRTIKENWKWKERFYMADGTETGVIEKTRTQVVYFLGLKISEREFHSTHTGQWELEKFSDGNTKSVGFTK